jgi:hypothetical protein
MGVSLVSAGDTYENRYLDAAYGATGRSSLFPATVVVELYTGAPSDAGGGTVVAGGAYAPASVVNSDTNFPAAVGGQKKNGTLIAFPVATANYPSAVTHFAMKDAVGGAIIDWGALTAPITVLAGQQFVFQPNQLVITAD